MASRITLYGTPNQADIKRLKREMNAMYVEYDLADPAKDARAKSHLVQWKQDAKPLPLVEILRADDTGSVFLVNPDEPTLRNCLYSENILSITAYWV